MLKFYDNHDHFQIKDNIYRKKLFRKKKMYKIMLNSFSFSFNTLSNIKHYCSRLHVIHNRPNIHITYPFHYTTHFNNSIMKIKNLAYYLLNYNGYNVVDTGFLSFISYKNKNKNNKNYKNYKNKLDTNYSTCIFCISKHKDIIGGNIEYLDSNNKKKIIEIKENSIVLFNGSIKKTPKYMNENLHTIVCTFKTNPK